MNKEKIIFLTGPTATGKSALAIELALHQPVEIISVDSAMIYQGMDIGTGKPSCDILAKIPHHLINICDPATHYSCGQFREDALRLIKAILNKGKIPLLVGGTMLYFKALKDGLAILPKAHLEIRKSLKQALETTGLKTMYEQLTELDPASAKRIHQNDTQRILRGLEVYYLTGKTLSTHLNDALMDPFPYQVLSIALTTQREQLHKRIAERFQQMLAQGFIEEVQHLLKREDLNLEFASLRAVGYRQISLYLTGQCSYQEMIDKGIAATRQLAKRQSTWLRAWSGLTWVNCEEQNLFFEVQEMIERFIYEKE